MSIIRSPRPERGFTIVSNAVAQDQRLSMRALGLLVRLLSRPDNWETNSATLAREFDVGREQMQGVLRELSDLGYMRLVKHRMDDGTFNSRWHVYDEPETTQPEHGKPAPENPYSGEPVAFKKNLAKKEQIQSAPHTPKGAISLPTWLDALKANGEEPMLGEDPVFDYAEQAGISLDMLRLCWVEFKSRYSEPNAKRYKDWRSVYRKAVRGNWLRLWRVNADGDYVLTTEGLQAQKVQQAKRGATA